MPQVTEWFPKGDFIFMCDSAQCHKAKSITKYVLKEKNHALNRPGNFEDLNPITKVWEGLKREISQDLKTNKI